MVDVDVVVIVVVPKYVFKIKSNNLIELLPVVVVDVVCDDARFASAATTAANKHNVKIHVYDKIDMFLF